nr:MAG TPA: resistance protein [Caudoviricetes sp.]DAS49963.1 MAG TPA: resistance protein [Caudoviricetes sp.]
MKLYEITSEMRVLDELFLSCIDEETGEVKDDGVIDILEQELKLQLQTKGAGIIKSFKNSEAMLNGVDEEIKRLQALKKSISNQINSRKEYIVRNMEMMGITKIETELGNLSLRKSKSVNIYDESLIDKKFIEIETKEKISKTEIKKAIEAGENVQGANIVEKNSLNIK